jgi:hypothetical protein
VHWALAVDIALYVVVVIFAGLAYAENNFRSVNVFHLPDYLPLQEYETKRRLIAARLANELINRDTIARKTRSTVIAPAALIAEVVLLAVTLIVVAAG